MKASINALFRYCVMLSSPMSYRCVVVSENIGVLSLFVTLMVRSLQAHMSALMIIFVSVNTKIHLQPFTDAEYPTAFYSESLSCPLRLLDVRCCRSSSSVPLNQFPHLAVELLFALCFPRGSARGMMPDLQALQVCHDCGITAVCLCQL